MTDNNLFEIGTIDGLDNYNRDVPCVVKYPNAATVLRDAKIRMMKAYDTENEQEVLEQISNMCNKMLSYHKMEMNKLRDVISPISVRSLAIEAVEKSRKTLDEMDHREPASEDGFVQPVR